MKRVGNKISYVKYPIARNSLVSVSLAAAGLLLTIGSITLSVMSAGQAGMIAGALGFSCIGAELMCLWYTFLAFREKGKNYILAKISCGIALTLLICWVMVIVVGIQNY